MTPSWILALHTLVTLTLEIWSWVTIMTHLVTFGSVTLGGILSRSNMAARSYGQDRFWLCLHSGLYLGNRLDCFEDLCHFNIFQSYRDFEAGDAQFLNIKWRDLDSNHGPLAQQAKGLTTRLLPLPTLKIWLWVIKVLIHPLVIDNNCVKYYPDPIWQLGVMAHTLILAMCSLWHWRYDHKSKSWHKQWSWKTIVWNLIQIRQWHKKYRLIPM